MIAFKVSKNGQPLCVAGAEDLGILNASIVAGGLLGSKSQKVRDDQTIAFHMHIGGLTSRVGGDDEHFHWNPGFEMKVGDKIQVEIVDVESADCPDSQTPEDLKTAEERIHLIEKTMAEEADKERFCEARKIYFQLKKQFEPNGS